ncbi:SDR family NAD(P)-dependent oxidoreductase [Sulfurovum sp. XGS-02]|uniref:SDR family NAD(P)-dependent oxidoreductase n=1 Tax=Sulfurovum sp. XGS-02 TaxID=2925411 RepID=UPI0020467972|nr:SDR family NAD(P)-dependent oxidoreductase [Sulfurovum sp. XGS-02]UPT77700.1 SDR family NAD(P)-dependent oxidoreductase [Sulfurovum sp. XGS-02]
MKNILITGVSSGLGEALAIQYLENGDSVYAIGKTLPKKLDHYPHFFFFPYDLSETFMIQSTLKEFLQHRSFDMVILNAGLLGEITTLSKTDLMDAKAVMEVNVWANKELIDTLHAHAAHVNQIVGISSGAAVNGSKGWGAYALSKAALNMLLSVYAKELPEIHFTALAPGVIRTPMVEHIIEEVDDTLFPSAKRLKENPIQTPGEAAKNLIATFPKLLAYESGSFLDVRTM